MKAEKTDWFSPTDEVVMQESCITFITTLVDQMRQQLPNNITVLQKTSLLLVENALCVMKEPLIPLLETMVVPPKTIEKFKNSAAKSPSLTGSEYHPRSRSAVKFTPIRIPTVKTHSPRWPDLPS